MLRARLLGALEVELDGTPVPATASQRPWAVFAYLALSPRPVVRAEIASTFWPDVLDQSARASLRSALWTLRRQLGDVVTVDGERVGLVEGEIWIDVREFERLAEDDSAQALALCRGELLEGLEDDWACRARDRHRERVVELHEGLAQEAERGGDARQAIEQTRRQVERDPLDEAAHRRLIERLGAAGDRAGAIRVGRSLSERLRRELGVAPSAATRELVEQLRAEAPATPPLPQPGLLPMIGRDAELAELERTWRSAGGGSGAAAVIRGEAGIGKTRLANEMQARVRAAGGLAAASAALDLGGAAPMSLWAELARDLLPWLPAPQPDAAWPEDLRVLAPELPAHFPRSAVPRATVAPDLQRTRLFEAAVAMLEWAARTAPLLLVLEDIHAADAPSLELAAYAGRRLAGLRVMMLITRRELPHSPDADRLEHALRGRGLLACELALGPLPAAGVARLVRNAASLEEDDVRRIVERADGNPLLAVETARALAHGNQDVAASLRGSARAMLADLTEDVRSVVEIAAVAARPLGAGEIAQLPISDPQDAAAEALQSGWLLAVGGGVGFRHALLRDAVCEEVASPRRPAIHLRWADALLASERAGSRPHPVEIARQLQLGGDDARAAPYLVRAALRARDVAALEEGVGYLEEALSLDPSRADAWLELAELEAWRGRREPAEAAFEQALQRLDQADPGELARALLRRARAYHGPICVPRAVLDSARRALELIDQIDPAPELERSEALAAWAWAEAVAGSVEQAEELLERLSNTAAATDELRVYDAGHARALALMRRGRFVEAYGPSIAAGEAIGRVGRPDLSYGCWANAASAATAAGEHERALEFLDRGMSALAGHGLQSLEIHLLAARSFVLRGLDRLSEARTAAEEEQALADQLGHPELLAMAAHDRGLVALAQREYARAASLLDSSLVDGAPISRPLTRLALAEALIRSGNPDPAVDELRAMVLEPVRPSDFPATLVPRLARVQGLMALAEDRRAEAEARLGEAVTGWECLVEQSVRAESITSVLADLGRPVVGLVEPDRELARTRAELDAIRSSSEKGEANAVVS